MKGAEVAGRTTIHTCKECGHQADDHEGSPHACSCGWCPCTRPAHFVRNLDPAKIVPTFKPRMGGPE